MQKADLKFHAGNSLLLNQMLYHCSRCYSRLLSIRQKKQTGTVMSFRKKSVKKQELLNLQGDMIMFTSQNSISVIAVLIILGIYLNCLAEEQATPAAHESLNRACFTEYTSSKLKEMSNSLRTIANGSIETRNEDDPCMNLFAKQTRIIQIIDKKVMYVRNSR